MRFKEHGRFVVFLAVLTGPSWGQSRPGLQGPDTQTHPEARPHGAVVLLATLPTLNRSLRPVHRVNVSLTASIASNRYRRRARRHTRESGPDRPSRSRASRQRVTHRLDCKQPIREEGTSTCTLVQTDCECQSPSPAATAPLPERQHHPFGKTGGYRPLSTHACTSMRSKNDPSGVPRGPLSRPSSALCYCTCHANRGRLTVRMQV
jgi:hypothetical protein